MNHPQKVSRTLDSPISLSTNLWYISYSRGGIPLRSDSQSRICSQSHGTANVLRYKSAAAAAAPVMTASSLTRLTRRTSLDTITVRHAPADATSFIHHMRARHTHKIHVGRARALILHHSRCTGSQWQRLHLLGRSICSRHPRAPRPQILRLGGCARLAEERGVAARTGE